MKRLHITAEGQTEEYFVKNTLTYYLGDYNISTDVRCVLTSKDKHRRDIIYRGGLVNYDKAKNDIVQWLKEEKNNNDVFFTTMFDLYALPQDFPDFEKAEKESDPYNKVKILEQGFAEDINDSRFIPYIQLHEFEALLFANPQMFEIEYFENLKGIEKLKQIAQEKGNPELINDGLETAPSKRIISVFPDYAHNKPVIGSTIANEIGMEKLMASCKHFSEWIEMLIANPQ